ncbi:MAG TPA: amino acid--tRNA ligase-related protein, partial [Nitrososphaerales archaeon]|nr:amino acid--tRNA ligase-related protein [Nitrososphaerales archaeon]
EDIRQLVEGTLTGLIGRLKKRTGDPLSSLGRRGGLEPPKVPFEVQDREALADRYGEEWEKLLPQKTREPTWVTNIPREFYDFEDPETGKWDNYDLFVPGYGEILSGARREWEYSKILKKMEKDDVRQENYALLLKLAREGRLRPSAGAGIGVERLISWIIGAKHIGEVQPFPKIPGIVYDL